MERGRRQLALLWGAGAVVLVALSPLGPWIAGIFLPACPFKTLTGLPCPSCGLTRSALELARLRFVHALVTYPLPTLAWIGFMVGGVVSAVWVLAGRRPPWPRRWPRWLPWALVAAVVANWIHAIATGV